MPPRGESTVEQAAPECVLCKQLPKGKPFTCGRCLSTSYCTKSCQVTASTCVTGVRSAYNPTHPPSVVILGGAARVKGSEVIVMT